MNSFKFTVFTPIFNRKQTIHRVWESLMSQSCKDFEWIIVNDGSTDGIEPLLDEYKKKAFFPVTIISQSNQGKHVAWNKAVEIAKGKLFVPADSDDSFVPEALEKFAFYWGAIETKSDFSGINVLCTSSLDNHIIGTKFPQELMTSNNLELFYRFKVTGEKWGCIRTDILKSRPFPEVKGNFFPENYIWLYIARNYSVLCVNEALRVYYVDESDSISNSLIRKKNNTLSLLLYSIWHINANKDYIFKYDSTWSIIKHYLTIWNLTFQNNYKIKKVLSTSKSFLIIFLLVVFLPLGFIYYCIGKCK